MLSRVWSISKIKTNIKNSRPSKHTKDNPVSPWASYTTYFFLFLGFALLWKLFMRYSRGNNIIKQCNILAYVWLSQVRQDLVSSRIYFIQKLPNEFPNDLRSLETKR